MDLLGKDRGAWHGPSWIYGQRVVIAPPESPKLKLSKDINVSDGFRAEFDLYLLERFGLQELPLDNRAFMFGDTLLISQKHADLLAHITA